MQINTEDKRLVESKRISSQMSGVTLLDDDILYEEFQE